MRRLGPSSTSGDRPAGAARVLYGAAVAFYVLYELATRGRMILGGSMWAEMGTNYYSTTITDRWYEQLVATDFGYIPLPQRIFALAANTVGIPPGSIPYVYTGGALVLSGLMLGAFCLPVFRDVIDSDLLRTALVVGVMLVPDFETRTFINFTYFSVVLIAVVCARSIVGRDHRTPGWIWVIPVLMISKPAVLAVFPVVVVAGIAAGRGRFRRVAVVTTLAAGVQVVRLAVSSLDGTSPVQPGSGSLVDKLVATAKYSLAFLGRLTTGPNTPLSGTAWIAVGAGVAILSLAVVLITRRPAGVLVPIGLSLVVLTMLINCFTFSAAFTRDLALLGLSGFDRRFFVAVVGAFLVVAGIIASVVEFAVEQLARRTGQLRRGLMAAVAGAAVFSAWFAGVGWAGYSAAVNQPLGAPVGDVSQWDQQAAVLASAEPVVCIPLDPFGWMYGRNCSVLVDANVTPAVFGWATLDSTETDDPSPGAGAASEQDDGSAPGGSVRVEAPTEVTRGALASVMTLVRPAAGVTDVTGTATLVSADGSTTVLRGEAELPASGGVVQFEQSPVQLASGVESVTFQFDQDVTIGSLRAEDARAAVVLWMGQP